MAKIDFGKVMLEISNNLSTREPGTALDAVQGYELNKKIEELESVTDNNSGSTESINNKLNEMISTVNGKAPTSHASSGTGYGAANSSNYGHVKLSDSYTSSAGSASGAVGASSLAVYNTYNTLNNSINGKLGLGGGTLTGDVVTRTIRPSANNTYNLGNASNTYHYAFVNNIEAKSNHLLLRTSGSNVIYAMASIFQVVNYANSAFMPIRASAFTVASDIRKKTNITNIEQKQSMDIITALNPLEYEYKSDPGRHHRGFSAQEIRKIVDDQNIPEQLYHYDTEKDEYFLDRSELIPDMVNCIKHLNTEIKQLKNQIEQLKETQQNKG